MAGINHLFVAIVLINNGVCGLHKVSGKSVAIVNFFAGIVLFMTNVVLMLNGDYLNSAMGLMFAFLYTFIGLNNILKLNLIPYGYYCLFACINSLICSILGFTGICGDWRSGVIWLFWVALLTTGFVECVFKKNYATFASWLAIVSGVVAGWIPAIMMLINAW